MLGRQATALGTLREFLPRRVWRDLATTTQNKLLSDLNAKMLPLSKNNRYGNVPITPELLENVFMARIHMALEPSANLKAAFAKVFVRLGTCHIPLSFTEYFLVPLATPLRYREWELNNRYCSSITDFIS